MFSKTKHIKDNHESNITKIQCTLCEFKAKNEYILEKHMNIAMGHKIQKQCTFFNNGFCKKGNFCRFQHLEMSMPPKNVNFAKRNPTMNLNRQGKSTQQCKYQSQCFNFPNCGYSHYELCRYQQNCNRGEFCKFVHLPFHSFLEFHPWAGINN